MTAVAARAGRPVHRVECCCGWVGYRVRPDSRDCPACGSDKTKLRAAWLAGCAPHKGRCAYIVEISPPYGHAGHYAGFTTDLPRRWREHLAGGYDPVTRRRTGKGARLLAAALHAGCTIELVRVWYGPQARQMEQRLKQRRKPGSLRAGARTSLKRLCPLCDPRAYRHYPELPPPPAPPPRWRRFRPDPEVWDADQAWDAAFPHLAYRTGPTAQATKPQGGHQAGR
jgi:predicted GIY-YIG superfamily endonuclease